jgi:hypothetical protein
MRRVLVALSVACVLVLTLVLPAAASKPMEVSGWFTGAGHTAEPPPDETRGGNCFLTRYYWHTWGQGSLLGYDEVVWEIVAHAPCEAEAANMQRENLRAKGWFEGAICLDGVYEGTECSGEEHDLSFEFTLEGQGTPTEDPTDATFDGRLTILDGESDLGVPHGVIELWGRTGREGWMAYEGRMHFE